MLVELIDQLLSPESVAFCFGCLVSFGIRLACFVWSHVDVLGMAEPDCPMHVLQELTAHSEDLILVQLLNVEAHLGDLFEAIQRHLGLLD